MSLPTIPPAPSSERLRRARAMRRTFLALLGLFVLLGALGLFGVRTATVHAAGGGYELELRYARVTRPGLATPWSVVIRQAGGFDGPVTLASTASYFDMFDENALEPEPESGTTDGEQVVWELAPPEQGDTMEVSLDARLTPNDRWGHDGWTAVLVDGRPVAEVRYRTWVMP